MTLGGNARIVAPARPVLLVLIAMPAASMPALQADFDVRYAPDARSRSDAVRDHGARVQAVLTNGTVGVRADEIDAMPELTLVCTLGAGYENVPIEHARARSIVVANGAFANDDCVADHPMALLLAVLRAVPAFDAAWRTGVWRSALPMRAQLAHRRVGILGLGDIGRKIARRLEGFDAVVGYHNRTNRGDVAYRYFGRCASLPSGVTCSSSRCPAAPRRDIS